MRQQYLHWQFAVRSCNICIIQWAYNQCQPHNHARGQSRPWLRPEEKTEQRECREFYSSNLVRLTAQLFRHPVALGGKKGTEIRKRNQRPTGMLHLLSNSRAGQWDRSAYKTLSGAGLLVLERVAINWHWCSPDQKLFQCPEQGLVAVYLHRIFSLLHWEKYSYDLKMRKEDLEGHQSQRLHSSSLKVNIVFFNFLIKYWHFLCFSLSLCICKPLSASVSRKI